MSCIPCLDCLDDFWEEHKYKISGKIALGLGILSSASSVMVSFPSLLVPASVALTLTNTGVFFAGIVMEKYKNENKKLYNDNKSLSNEKNEMIRRMTNFNFPISDVQTQQKGDETPKSEISITSTATPQMMDFNALYKGSNPF